jgi:enoyl-CoA hydratase/carnithine racemase
VMLRSLAHADLADALRARYDAAERMLASEDAVEGPAAFAQKRTPVWRGR